MSGAFSEDTLIEQPAIEVFSALGWRTVGAFHEVFGPGGTLGRENAGDAVLLRHLLPALKKLNPEVPQDAINAAVNELTRERSVMSLAGANREVYSLLKNGVKVEIRNADGELVPERIRVMDWDNPSNNHFVLVSQLWVTGEMYKRRLDLVGFVNGLPLVVVEFKSVKERVEAAFKDNITDYKQTIPHLFVYNGLILVSNRIEGRMGSVTATWEHFCDWKKMSSEAEGAACRWRRCSVGGATKPGCFTWWRTSRSSRKKAAASGKCVDALTATHRPHIGLRSRC